MNYWLSSFPLFWSLWAANKNVSRNSVEMIIQSQKCLNRKILRCGYLWQHWWQLTLDRLMYQAGHQVRRVQMTSWNNSILLKYEQTMSITDGHIVIHSYQHIEAVTKWPTFSRQHFLFHWMKTWIYWFKIYWNLLLGRFSEQKLSFASGIGLELSRQQAISWTKCNDDTYMCHLASMS